MSPVDELALLDFDRSNKGASKQRRDQINAEIATMRDLLPLPESSRQRLSQLQIMSLTCVYIRKCNVLHKLFRSKSQEPFHLPESLDFFQALTGFLLVTTREGKLLYISENVTDFLGHSMVDMKTQGDSLFDIVDKRDHGAVRAQLFQGSSLDEDSASDVTFFCRMNMSRTLKRQSGFGDVKVMHVRGHFIRTTATESPAESVFMATCSPLITPDLKENLIQNNTMVFKTVHQLDMAFVEITKTAEYHLGYSCEDLSNKSWYAMLHPEDIHEAKDKHLQLIRSNHEMGCMMTVRMLKADGSLLWVNIVMHVRQATAAQNDDPLIVCINQVIDAQEAYQIKVQGHMFSVFPNRPHELWGGQQSAVSPSDASSGHWMPPAMMPYPSNIPSYISGHPAAYNGLYNPVVPPIRLNKSEMANVQSDQLKAILKRKIQGQAGSCKPSKVAKTSWEGNPGGASYSSTQPGIPLLEDFGQVAAHSECQGQTMQVLQPLNYRVGVMTAKQCSRYSPPLMSKMSRFSEQVVPDVNLPDSYLTPDPSPISSPEPSYVHVKSEVLEVRDDPGRVNILQALEKLAALENLPPKAPAIRLCAQAGNTARKSKELAGNAAKKSKELPVFDAIDIDNFFDTLRAPLAKALPEMEVVPQDMPELCDIKSECLELAVENIPNFAALKEERSSPVHVPSMLSGQQDLEPAVMPESYLLPTPDFQTAAEGRPRALTPAGAQENLQDLLSYFSDDGMSPLHMSGSLLDSSASDDQFTQSYQKPFFMESPCSLPLDHMEGELSPQSNTSSLAGEDDYLDDHSTFTLDLALNVLHVQQDREDLCPMKERDVLTMPEDLKLDFMTEFFLPPQGSLIKHGQ
ncbi:uncharacterized protein LOC131935567 [Physella acuta]|uniref:uncharacterized protein LOC131935567 n=1 Tax=Physella acuta TaxID=109671 RepID=UPI0027DBF0B2|nr:uncharacterized protein LOC131935567 [Physella acuta]